MSDAEMEDLSKNDGGNTEQPLQGDTYVLSKVIKAHSSDAKALALNKSGTLISAGRDGKIIFWNKKAGEYKEAQTFTQPPGLFVNSLAFANTADGWRLFAGRKDGSIAAYGSGSTEPLQVYKEHGNNVCCLYVNEKLGILMSGSWDNVVIVWPINDLNNSKFTSLKLVKHTLSVWALAAFPDKPDYYLSGSADKTIVLWNRDDALTEFKGHSDVVRALSVISNEHFLSAGNDGYICYWDVASATLLGKFKTHAHDFIYSMTLCDSHVLTTGEDGTLEFWSIKHNSNTDKISINSEIVIQTPSASTWDLKVLPSSDVAVSSSDGRIYIFSKDPERQAVKDIRDAFDAEVVAKITAQLARKKESDVVVIKVALDDGPPRLELKYEKGTDPTLAAEKFIRDNNLPISYLNEVVEYICANIPEARAAKMQRNRQPMEKKSLDGKDYDFVFDVTLEDGTVLKMPYNRDQDPDYAAQLFVEKNNLPVKFLGMLSQLIRSETSGMSSQSVGGYDDPFTGSGRYVPGMGQNSNAGSFADPFTGQGRYVPGMGSNANNSQYSGDPFTGSGAYRTGDSAGAAVPLSSLPIDKKRPRGPLVPIPEYYLFGSSGTSQKAVLKLKEMNSQQEANQLLPDELVVIEELLTAQVGNLSAVDVIQNGFEKALNWPIEYLAPVMDFFRIALLHEPINSHFCSQNYDLFGRFMAILISDPKTENKDDFALRVFVCRCIANSFSHKAGRGLFASNEINNLAPQVVKHLLHEKAILQLACSTALANWSLALFQQSEKCDQMGPKEDLVRSIVGGLENVQSFGYLSQDSIIRLLQAIVTLLWGDTNLIKMAKNSNVTAIVNRLKDAVVSDQGKNIARDIVEMTYAV